MVTRHFAVHCEVTAGYRGNKPTWKYLKTQRQEMDTNFVGYKGYKTLCCAL